MHILCTSVVLPPSVQYFAKKLGLVVGSREWHFVQSTPQFSVFILFLCTYPCSSQHRVVTSPSPSFPFSSSLTHYVVRSPYVQFFNLPEAGKKKKKSKSLSHIYTGTYEVRTTITEYICQSSPPVPHQPSLFIHTLLYTSCTLNYVLVLTRELSTVL